MRHTMGRRKSRSRKHTKGLKRNEQIVARKKKEFTLGNGGEPLKVYTDGSCKPNPGPGGYAVVAELGGAYRVLDKGRSLDSTNNRMEIMALCSALEHLNNLSKAGRLKLDKAIIYSDSAYVVNSVSKGWIYKWRMQKWNTGPKGEEHPVKNVDLWKSILQNLSKVRAIGLDVKVMHVKGHNGNVGNELADRVAQSQADRASQELKAREK